LDLIFDVQSFGTNEDKKEDEPGPTKRGSNVICIQNEEKGLKDKTETLEKEKLQPYKREYPSI
jgi:hypothetical protein